METNKLAENLSVGLVNFATVGEYMLLTNECTEKEMKYKSLAEVVEGYKFYAIYFSEKTCPAVIDFNEMLCKFYEEVNKDGAKNV